MPRFRQGQRILVPLHAQGAYSDIHGRVGTITLVVPVNLMPDAEEATLEQYYLVTFDGDDGTRMVEESWLEPESRR